MEGGTGSAYRRIGVSAYRPISGIGVSAYRRTGIFLGVGGRGERRIGVTACFPQAWGGWGGGSGYRRVTRRIGVSAYFWERGGGQPIGVGGGGGKPAYRRIGVSAWGRGGQRGGGSGVPAYRRKSVFAPIPMHADTSMARRCGKLPTPCYIDFRKRIKNPGPEAHRALKPASQRRRKSIQLLEHRPNCNTSASSEL